MKIEDSGNCRDLQREFMEAAVRDAQGATPQADEEIATALRKMLTDLQKLTPSRRTPAATRSNDNGTSYAVSSSEADSFNKAEVMQTTRSIDLYYRRHEAHIRAVEAREGRLKAHEEKIDLAMDLLLSTLSNSVRTTFKAELPTRRLDFIWSKITSKCGPRSGTEGIGELAKE
jgi:hypothetical protein